MMNRSQKDTLKMFLHQVPSRGERRKSQPDRNPCPADKEAKYNARSLKEDVKKKVKVVTKKAKLVAVQTDKTEVNRGRRQDRQPQCHVCHETRPKMLPRTGRSRSSGRGWPNTKTLIT